MSRQLPGGTRRILGRVQPLLTKVRFGDLEVGLESTTYTPNLKVFRFGEYNPQLKLRGHSSSHGHLTIDIIVANHKISIMIRHTQETWMSSLKLSLKPGTARAWTWPSKKPSENAFEPFSLRFLQSIHHTNLRSSVKARTDNNQLST